MPRMIFVNLPVKDLAAAIRFYEAIGCKKNDQFSDDNSASMVWSDSITFQLLTHDYFATFTPKPIADAQTTTEVLVALSCDSRERQDLGFMYGRAFADPDGHVFEPIWMDPEAVATAPGE